MYLVKAERNAEFGSAKRPAVPLAESGGLARLAMRVWHWWKARGLAQQRRAAKKQLFLLETLTLGPKQRVVLMRCGAERFLVGTGAEGVTSVVRVQEATDADGLSAAAAGDGRWG